MSEYKLLSDKLSHKIQWAKSLEYFWLKERVHYFHNNLTFVHVYRRNDRG